MWGYHDDPQSRRRRSSLSWQSSFQRLYASARHLNREAKMNRAGFLNGSHKRLKAL